MTRKTGIIAVLLTAALLAGYTPVICAQSAVEALYAVVQQSGAEDIDRYIQANAGALTELDFSRYNEIEHPAYVWRQVQSEKALTAQNLPAVFARSVEACFVTWDQTPADTIYFYRLDYQNTGEKRLLVNQKSSYSAYSTYALACFKILNIPSVRDIRLSVYFDRFRTERSGGTVYGSVWPENYPGKMEAGLYAAESQEYSGWEAYFNSRKTKAMPLFSIDAEKFPDTRENQVFGGKDSNGADYYVYTGWQEQKISDMIPLLNAGQDTDGAGYLAVSNSAGANVTVDMTNAKLRVTYDLTAELPESAAVELLNSANSREQFQAVLVRFQDYFGTDAGLLYDIGPVCEKLYAMRKAGTVFTLESLRKTYAAAVAECLVSITLQPEDYLLYQYGTAGTEACQVAVNTAEQLNADSAYELVGYCLRDCGAIRQIAFTMYADQFLQETSAGTFYYDAWSGMLPGTAEPGVYPADSAEYAAWGRYFENRENALFSIDQKAYPGIVWPESGYTGPLCKEITEVLPKLRAAGDGASLLLSGGPGNSAALSWKTAELSVQYDVTQFNETGALAAVNCLGEKIIPESWIAWISLYNICFGIDSAYLQDFSSLSAAQQHTVVSEFGRTEYQSANQVKDAFEACVRLVYEGEANDADRAVFSTDFSADWKFAQYFLGLLDLEDMPEVKAAYAGRDYMEALSLYRNAVLDALCRADLDEFSYGENCYAQRKWGEFFAGVSKTPPSTANGYDILVNLNLQGDPSLPIAPDWKYSIQFPAQSQLQDISYFTCFTPIVAMYYDTGDPIYVRKWMQITNAFCTQHRRWYMENVTEPPASDHLSWDEKNAQSALNQAGRIENIIRGLGAFAKLAGGRTAPWTEVLAPAEPPAGPEAYQAVDPVMLANIVMSLVYDHAEAMIKRYVPDGATPNQRFSGLTALAMTDLFFGGSQKFREEYTAQIAEGFQNYVADSFFPDGGMVEQAFNYNAGDLHNMEALCRLYQGTEEVPDYIVKLREHSQKARRLQAAIAFPDGSTPAVGLGEGTADPKTLPQKDFTSAAFPYIGFYSMRSGWEPDNTNLFMQSARRTRGHLYPSSNAIELYAYGRKLLMNGGAPWYAENMAPADQAGEYLQYNQYFGESSSFNRNTVLVDGLSQSGTNFDGASPGLTTISGTTGQKWHTSADFDFVSADYTGGYGNPKMAGTVHNRQVVYLKGLNMFVVADTVDTKKDSVECSTVWNFPPALTKAEDGVEVDGFKKEEVLFDTNRRTIYTADSQRANVFLYQFYPGLLEYRQYYGYKGSDGYKGFYANGFGRRYPKVDMHVTWTENGKKTPMLTLIEPAASESKIIAREDLSYSVPDGGCSAFRLKTAEAEAVFYGGSTALEYDLDGFKIRAKTVAAVERNGRKAVLVLGAENQPYADFEAVLEDSGLREIQPVTVPAGFSWKLDEAGVRPVYNGKTDSVRAENLKIDGWAYFGETLALSCDYVNAAPEKSRIQWYTSTDRETWTVLPGSTGAQYQIPDYKRSDQARRYYMAAIQPVSADGRWGTLAFSNISEASAYQYDDFENSCGALYNLTSLQDETMQFAVTGRLEREENNTFLRLTYQDYNQTGGNGIGYQAGKTDPYLNRWWKPMKELAVAQTDFRIDGPAVRVSLSFIKSLAEVTPEGVVCFTQAGRQPQNWEMEQKQWYTLRCIINPTRQAISGMQPETYRLALRKNGEAEWKISQDMPLPAGDFSQNGDSNTAAAESDGKGNRFYVHLGSNSQATRNIVDIDNYGILPAVSVSRQGYRRTYGGETDQLSYLLRLKNNDPTQSRSKVAVVAVYEENRLIQAETKTIRLAPDAEIITDFTFSVNPQVQDQIVRCMVLNDMETITPALPAEIQYDYE